MGQLALQARGNRMLGVGGDGEVHAKLGTRAAGATFANSGQGGGYGLFDDLDLRLVAHGLGQTLLQRGNIDNPGQRFDFLRCRIKLHLTIEVAKDLHGGDGRGIFVVRPAAQRLQHSPRADIECIGAHVLVLRTGLRGGDQRHAQPLTGEQKSQSPAHNAGPTNTYIKGLRHDRHCRRPGPGLR